MKTAITDLLDIDMPIILPGMSWISTSEVVAAVSNAGELGILATGLLTPNETREAIVQIRALTDKPFGIGVTLLIPGAEENAFIAIEEKVAVINFSLEKGDKPIERADALLVTGHDAAAHGADGIAMRSRLATSFDSPCIKT
ncbi:MAG: enoyl-[acyl-carrier protein] reductase II [Oleispira sp.]